MKLYHNGHLTEAALQALMTGALDEQQSLDIAQHVADCEPCAAKLAEIAVRSDVRPPRGMTELTLEAIAQQQHKKKQAFYRFCLQVAACAVIVVGVLVTGILRIPDAQEIFPPADRAPIPPPTVASIPAPGEKQTVLEQVGDFFKGLSNNLFQSEEQNND